MDPVDDDDFKERRDGLYEHRGTWDEVTVGTLLATDKRSEAWEVIATAHGPQVQYGYTLWFRVRERTTGEEKSLAPRMKIDRVNILTEQPETLTTPPRTPPSDAEQILLLVESLGATVLATQDNATGEITCPDYASGHSVGDNRYGREEIEHLRIAHNIDAEGMRVEDRVTLHGRAHSPKHPTIGKTGFPHRHVPEDMALLAGKMR